MASNSDQGAREDSYLDDEDNFDNKETEEEKIAGARDDWNFGAQMGIYSGAIKSVQLTLLQILSFQTIGLKQI